jgi:prolyl oligopeptidase
MNGEVSGDELFMRFASYTWPPTILKHSVVEHETTVFATDAPESEGPRLRTRATEDYETTQTWYASRDGTRVSMFLVQRRDTPRDGDRPVWLNAYGGFNINIVPDFDPAHFVWLDRGGVLAVPNLRGGGEYGEAWHEAGMLARKQNVFDDFIAAAEHLIAEGYTRAGRLVFEGGSNGGLLVSAVLMQRPDLPGAVICRVPVADMLRYHLFTVGRFWIPEYGSADDPAQFQFLYDYSPLHRVRDDVRYPPVLIMTAETDDRVDPGMARKLAARLQAACMGAGGAGGPVCIRIERRAGHGAGKPVTKLIEEDADIYAFALQALFPQMPK